MDAVPVAVVVGYRFGIADIGRGDTVVFWFPGDPSKSYIKRVIGAPGDTIEVIEGKVIVNGRALSEPYVPDEYRDHVSLPRSVVPADQYFVLGDHRSSSNDSRVWGFVPDENIVGKAFFIWLNLNELGRFGSFR